ncbi:hypothetical protein LXT21_20265 [Myxococcus sp. K38C18041901]|uniref:hypothetical protein n=1 Tax=Myxococcus guangdongensis TaxID=2906760 RepID=UPI0020A80DB5|nr:hypothetical protein [Myxococcus guangdongensis]MCP3061119.1 hypothetical protein [Myxococcus guangdongensis]
MTAGTARADTTFHDVTEAYQGNPWQIWLTAGNGFSFCRQRGFNTMVDFTGTCGEDESSYLDHVFATNTWVLRSSGSMNGCYPLFSSITCR